MGTRTQDHVAVSLAPFMEGVKVLKAIRGIKSDSALARMVEKKTPGGPSRKTVNNVLAGRHDPQVSQLQAIADALECPLWVLFLVGRKSEDLQSPARERLIAMVRDYLQCDNDSRHHVENMATAFAAKPRKTP